MSLSERARSNLYTGLSRIVDQEAVAEMLANFSARDVDEPVTKDHLDAQIALVRSELHVEIAGLRTEIKDEITGLRTEVKDGIMELRAESTSDTSELRGDTQRSLADLQGHIETALRQQLYWLVGTMISLFAICTTLILALQ